jgi:hypothetical protein
MPLNTHQPRHPAHYEGRQTQSDGTFDFELVRRITDAKLEACPKCGAPVTQVINCEQLVTTWKGGPPTMKSNVKTWGEKYNYKYKPRGIYKDKTFGPNG